MVSIVDPPSDNTTSSSELTGAFFSIIGSSLKGVAPSPGETWPSCNAMSRKKSFLSAGRQAAQRVSTGEDAVDRYKGDD